MRQPHFKVEARSEGEARLFRVTSEDCIRDYHLAAAEQQDYLGFHESLSRDFGTRLPRNCRELCPSTFGAPYRPVLTDNIAPGIFYGYGDPAVCRVGDAYYLYVTSNDAPDAFPILRSFDLTQWQHVGFAFPRGCKPSWAAEGAHVSDYWAPELQRVGDRYLLCFTARREDGSLAIGMASAPGPEGPFTPQPQPLLGGKVIDAHIFVDADGAPFLFWKDDSNDRWPGLLAEMLSNDADLAECLFPEAQDRRTATFAAALSVWASGLPPMERFFAFQPLIEASVENFSSLYSKLAGFEGSGAVLEAMRTPIFAQPLAPDGLSLTGDPRIVLVNDLAWEGHLIEGPWVTRQERRYYLFYAGNDFTTADYGIGVAVADAPLGPYRKLEQPLLRSTAEWSGPGHPSVAPGLDGRPQIFFHAFNPGRAGYKEFRALLTAGLDFSSEGVKLSC